MAILAHHTSLSWRRYSSMAAPVALNVYCAFSVADAELINNDSMIATSLFDVEFIPLKATVTASIEGALRRKASELAHRAAVEITTWYVLELKFNAQQVCSMFLAKQLFHCRALDGSTAYRMYGDSLRLNGDDPPVYCWNKVINQQQQPTTAKEELLSIFVSRRTMCRNHCAACALRMFVVAAPRTVQECSEEDTNYQATRFS